MNPTPLRDAVRRRIELRRGRLHPFSRIDAARTALVVVDMQNGFVAPGGASEVPGAQEIVANINRLAGALRAAGGLVVFLQHTVDAQALQSWSTFFDHLISAERREALKTAYAPGMSGHDLWPAMDVQPQDMRLEKRRFSAFIQGSSQLDEQLRSRGIDTVVIVGTVTNVCCESTARDAMMLNYKVVFVSDGNAALDDEEHGATLGSLATHFADVRTTDEVVSIL